MLSEYHHDMWAYLDIPSLTLLISQIDCEISQSRSKSKEKCLANIVSLFPTVDLVVPSDVMNKRAKEIRQSKLTPLAGPDGTANPPFIFIPPEWEMEDGKIKIDAKGGKVMLQPARKPFFSPTVLGVFKTLWFGENARWRGFKIQEITTSQLAFVCGLVRCILHSKSALRLCVMGE